MACIQVSPESSPGVQMPPGQGGASRSLPPVPLMRAPSRASCMGSEKRRSVWSLTAAWQTKPYVAVDLRAIEEELGMEAWYGSTPDSNVGCEACQLFEHGLVGQAILARSKKDQWNVISMKVHDLCKLLQAIETEALDDEL